MAFRLNDWQCSQCGHIDEYLVPVPSGGNVPSEYRDDDCPCKGCGETTTLQICLSLPAPYMGEKVCNPKVMGGRFDTMGHRKIPPLPRLPSDVAHERAVTAAVNELGPNATRKQAADRAMEVKGAPCVEEWKQHFSTPEYREVERKRAQIKSENKQKQKRAKAWQQGAAVNMRNDKCAGDPAI